MPLTDKQKDLLFKTLYKRVILAIMTVTEPYVIALPAKMWYSSKIPNV
jgi:hypothetical protein